jgi:hypothetical protein
MEREVLTVAESTVALGSGEREVDSVPMPERESLLVAESELVLDNSCEIETEVVALDDTVAELEAVAFDCDSRMTVRDMLRWSVGVSVVDFEADRLTEDVAVREFVVVPSNVAEKVADGDSERVKSTVLLKLVESDGVAVAVSVALNDRVTVDVPTIEGVALPVISLDSVGVVVREPVLEGPPSVTVAVKDPVRLAVPDTVSVGEGVGGGVIVSVMEVLREEEIATVIVPECDDCAVAEEDLDREFESEESMLRDGESVILSASDAVELFVDLNLEIDGFMDTDSDKDESCDCDAVSETDVDGVSVADEVPEVLADVVR